MLLRACLRISVRHSSLGASDLRHINIFSETAQRAAGDRLAHLSKRVPAPGYGYDYFDNPECIGYGGYRYDGRYKPAAARMCDLFGLAPGSKVLEIGCAKGFILYEFHLLGHEVTGLDASAYAISQAQTEIREKLRLQTSAELPFADQSFDFVLAKEVIPHLEESDALKLIQEIMRVGRASFLQIQCADTPESADLMKRWDVTHQTIRPEAWWVEKLEALGYRGAYHCRALF